MDKTLVIGCRTTENELLAVMRAAGISYDLVWIEARLHNVKKKLNKALSDLISEAENYDTILFCHRFLRKLGSWPGKQPCQACPATCG